MNGFTFLIIDSMLYIDDDEWKKAANYSKCIQLNVQNLASPVKIVTTRVNCHCSILNLFHFMRCATVRLAWTMSTILLAPLFTNCTLSAVIIHNLFVVLHDHMGFTVRLSFGTSIEVFWANQLVNVRMCWTVHYSIHASML